MACCESFQMVTWRRKSSVNYFMKRNCLVTKIRPMLPSTYSPLLIETIQVNYSFFSYLYSNVLFFRLQQRHNYHITSFIKDHRMLKANNHLKIYLSAVSKYLLMKALSRNENKYIYWTTKDFQIYLIILNIKYATLQSLMSWITAIGLSSAWHP